MDGEPVLRKSILPAKPFRRSSADKVLYNNFWTFDVETIKKENNQLTPYLICAFDGEEHITSFGENQNELFKNFFNQLLSKIKKGTTIVYAHNLSGFDGIFLMKHLLSFGKVTPLLFNGKLISIKVKGETGTKIIVFKDSYLLLSLSLRKLCIAFNITAVKGYFSPSYAPFAMLKQQGFGAGSYCNSESLPNFKIVKGLSEL
jgi:hypothetical protein